MFEVLYVQNFQRWDKFKLEFDPRITTITGPSDAGKSSLLRALRWLCLNSPQGDGFLRRGAPGTTIQLILDGGQNISRKRGRGDNLYLLNKEEFRSFGSSVPSTISDILRVTGTNFQGQKDGPFWFCESSGEVSRQLNDVVDLGIIDTSLYEVTKVLRTRQETVRVVGSRLAKAREKKESLSWVVEADADVRISESLLSKLTQIRGKTALLQRLVAGMRQSREALDTATSLVESLRSTGRLGADAIAVEKRRSRLEFLLQGIKQHKSKVRIGYPDISELSKVVDKIEENQKKIKRLSSMIRKVKAQRSLALEAKKSATRDENNLNNAMVGLCPVCGKEM